MPADFESFDSFLRALAVAPTTPAPVGTSRFRLGRRLGEGGFGVVHEVEDRERGGRLAAKFLRHPHPEWLVRFKNEFRALADLSHPNLVRLHELHNAGAQWFFTMELIDGGDLGALFGAPHATLRNAFAQVALGLCALHATGKIHRDVKPANVLVGRDGRCCLADFGLVLDVERAGATVIAGTPRYMSPEQSTRRPLGPASDWYSFGVMLAEAFGGVVPDREADTALMRPGAEPGDVPAGRLPPGAPPDLEQLCLALLQRDPEKRPSAAEILAVLTGASGAPRVATPSEIFVGRADLLELLGDALVKRPAVVLLHGPSGIGKSAVLGQFVARQGAGAVALTGRCYERELVPYKALDAVVDGLARYLRDLPEPAAAALLPRDVVALTQLFPVLEQARPVARAAKVGVAPSGDPAEVRRRGGVALRELLARLGDRHPLIVWVDDLHWGDADSAGLLAEILRPPDAPALLFVGSYRSDEGESPLLVRLAELRRTALSGLEVIERAVPLMAAADSRALAAAVLTDAGRDAGLAERIAEESGGNPLFAVQLTHEGEVGTAPTLDDFIRAKVARLPEPARRLLVAVAAAGRSVELSIAGELAGADQLREALDALRDARLLRSRDVGGSPGVEIYHDRVQRSVIADLSAEERARLCRGVADALERHGHDDAERLAVLLDEAGERARAAVYFERAADRAAAALAFDHAADLYRRALAARAGADRGPLLRRLIDALLCAGRAEEAAVTSLEAAALAGDVAARELRIGAAGALLVAGHFERGSALLAEAVAPLGIRLPKSKSGAVASLFWNELRLGLRGTEHAIRAEADVPADVLARIDGLWAGIAGFAVGNPLFTAALVPRFLRVALDAGEPLRLARALASRAMTLSIRRGTRARGTGGLVDQAERLVERIDSDAGRATVRLARGVLATAEARTDDAIASFRAAEGLLRAGTASAHAEIGRALTLRLHNVMSAGRIGALLAEAPAIIVESEERGNRMAASWMMSYVAWARTLQGRTEEGAALSRELEERWRGTSFPMLGAWLGAERASRQFHRSPGAAAAELEAGWDRGRKNGLLHSLPVRCHLGWMRARVRLADAIARKDRGALAASQRDADRFAREPVVSAVPLADLIRAGIRSARGDGDGALALLAAAEPRLEALHLEHVLAAVRRVRGRALGGDAGRALVARAESWLADQGVLRPDDWERFLLPGVWG